MCKEIYLDAPSVGAEEKEYLHSAVDSGYVSTIGPFVPEFEEKVSQYIGAPKAVAVQSGTAALHMALYELGIGPGDEVIVPALTFVATVNPVMYVGATPVFVDVDRCTWNIDPQEIKKHITPKTKAIIPVHLYGNPCDMDAIMTIAQEHELYVIEDATESLGALYKGKHTGTFGDFGCFSFNGNKIITTGGGGMIVGSDLKRLEHIKFLVNQARDESEECYHPEIGFNNRMTNIEAALGLAQMKRFGAFLERKRLFNTTYRKQLKGIGCCAFQGEYENISAAYWLTCIIFEKETDVPAVQVRLKEKKIPTRRVFMPVVEFPPYQKYKKSKYANAYYIFKQALCLPSSTLNSKSGIEHVCEMITSVIS